MPPRLLILGLQAVTMYLLVLGAHSLRHRFGPVHFYALLGGITAIMSWVTDAGLAVSVGGITFVLGSSVFYTSLLLGVFVIYVFDGPGPARAAISTVMGVSILTPVVAAVLHVQMGLAEGAATAPIPRPDLRINTASVITTFVDLIFLGVAWEILGKPRLNLGLWFRTWLTLLSVMWLDVFLFATGAFAGTPAFASIATGTLVSRFIISLFALPFLYGYLTWQMGTKPTAFEDRPVLTILRRVEQVEAELTSAQREIERRKRAEAALRESKVMLSATGKMAKVGGWRLDPATRELRWSEQTWRIYELPLARTPTVREALDFYHSEDRAVLVASLERAISCGEPYDLELRLTTAQGNERWIRTVCRPTVVAGETVELQGTIQDITEWKAMEEQLRQQDRLAALGQMAAGIAHDFRNRLNVVILNSQMAIRSSSLPPAINDKFEIILDESKGMADLVQRILDFGSRAMMTPEPVDLVELASHVLDEYRPELPPNVHASLEVEPDDHAVKDYTVEVDRGRLRQALSNVIQNALDAMPGGGVLQVRLSRVTEPQGDLSPPAEVRPGTWICVSMSDTGTGMTEAVQEHLFEPFFTTKDIGRGTGLGLAQVYGIVRQHDGIIGVDTAPGEGTTVHIHLPVWDGGRGGEVPAEPETLGRAGTILLVDPDDASRRKTEQFLQSLGYDVIPARAGEQALALSSRPRWSTAPRRRVDVLVARWNRSRYSGPELVQELMDQEPFLRAILIADPDIPDQEIAQMEHSDVIDVTRGPLDDETLKELLSGALQTRGLDRPDPAAPVSGVENHAQ